MRILALSSLSPKKNQKPCPRAWRRPTTILDEILGVSRLDLGRSGLRLPESLAA